ncbi:MAG TPA: gamma-glutamyl-gamma-aminobutyrate hydrolase family protein [Stellaceae bacterium]|jgi:putative glutamine amidotransferase|nr:gamma-glutamyl-gamma-aminobutyrate hydrolase family protein [Stellaceae bacterium]
MPRTSAAAVPVVGLPCCTRLQGEHQTHWVGEKYIAAVSDAAAALPLLVPALGERLTADEVLPRIDGLLLTGSRSNVEPHHYGGGSSAEGTLHDPQRDALTLPLIRAAVAADMPVLAICRGIQELNVALGGSLHQRVHEVAGRLDHRAPEGDAAVRYAHIAHAVRLAPEGMLLRLAGRQELIVNSLHAQGIDRLAPDLAIEATAPDGQIEAVRHNDAAFVVGVQWHPEYRVLENPLGRALFAAFGEACRVFARRRGR